MLASVLEDPSARIIVVLNGASDETKNGVEELRLSHSGRISTIIFTKNQGSAPAFSKGLAVAYGFGDEILILDDDNPIREGVLAEYRVAVNALTDSLGPGRYALAGYREVSRVHRSIAAGEPVDDVFRELIPGAYQGFDLISMVARKIDRRKGGTDVHEYPVGDRQIRLARVPNTMWGGLFLSVEAARQHVLPNAELVLYGDDNDFSAGLRSAGCQVYLCLDIELEDIVQWKPVSQAGGIKRFMPAALQVAERDESRLLYLYRNQAYLSRRQMSDDFPVRVRAFVNASVRGGALLFFALVAGKLPRALRLLRASRQGTLGKLGKTYVLPS